MNQTITREAQVLIWLLWLDVSGGWGFECSHGFHLDKCPNPDCWQAEMYRRVSQACEGLMLTNEEAKWIR